MNFPEEKLDGHFRWILPSAATLLLGTVAVYLIYFHSLPVVRSTEKWGHFGDYFGGVLNPLLGFLTLICLLFTLAQNRVVIRQSKDELEMSRNMLELAKDELESLKIANQNQISLSEERSLEDTIFRLFSFHQEMLNAVTYVAHGEVRTGVSALNAFLDIINRKLHASKSTGSTNNSTSEWDAYYQHILCPEHGQLLLRVWNVLSCVITTIDRLPALKRYFHIRLLKAQMSQSELILLEIHSKSLGEAHSLFQLNKELREVAAS